MSIYHIAKDGKQLGAIEEGEVWRNIEAGQIDTSDLCWREGMPGWQPIGTVLKVLSPPPLPPPLPASADSVSSIASVDSVSSIASAALAPGTINTDQTHAVENTSQNEAATPPSHLYGVKGWLKFFVVANLYIAPVLFVLQYILAWIGFFYLAEDYPGIIFVGLIETVVGGSLVWKWIQIARHLRDVRQGVVQETKAWLKITLGWSILNKPLAFISGINAEYLLPSAIRGIFITLIAFAIWYSYFNVSKRVKATYPDWDG